jgi:hypothetical protein
MRIKQFDRFKRIGDFRCKKIAMLKSDVSGRSLKMDVGPSAFLKPVGLL